MGGADPSHCVSSTATLVTLLPSPLALVVVIVIVFPSADTTLLLRWRGHRYLSVRDFDRALADLVRGSTIDPTIYGIWYHLGVVQFVRGAFEDTAASFAKAQLIAPYAAELAGSTDWLWMSQSRAGRSNEAKAMLDRHLDEPVLTA